MHKPTSEQLAVLQAAYKAGHAWTHDPDLRYKDMAKLNPSQKLSQAIVADYQKSDLNIEAFAQRYHQRALEPDGDVGPATFALTEVPRCPMPDVAPPAGADLSWVEDDDLSEAMRTMATGSGSWPVPGCDPERPNREKEHSIRVSLDMSGAPSRVRGYIDEALEAVRVAYAEIGLAVRYILEATDDCEIKKRFTSQPAGWIGWNEFPQAGTCRQVINGRLHTKWTPSDYLYWASLECHETGHGVKLAHTRGGVMNPSILYFNPLTWKGDPRERQLNSQFGGKPIPLDPEEPDDPDDPDVPDPPEHNGLFLYEGKTFKIKVWE